MNRFRFVIFCEYINNMQRNSQKENSLAPYLCLGSKGNKFLHYTAQGGSICVGCSAILCMLVHNANLSRDKLFYIPGPLPGRKAEKKPRYLFLFFFSFSFSFLLFILSLSFIVKGAFSLKWWPTPYIKPVGNSIPVYTIRGPEWEVLHKYATSTGVVFSRFCPFSKIEYDFRGSHGTEKNYLSFQLQTTPNGYKRKKNKRNIYHSNWV